MSKFLEIQPKELKFTVELRRQSSCPVRLANVTNYYVAFKVKTTAPKKYCVKPNVGIVLPNSTCHITVKRQAPQTATLDLECNDKFLVQSTIVSAVTTVEDITFSMFADDGGNHVEENKLRAILIAGPPDSRMLSPIDGDLNQGLHVVKVDLPISFCLGFGGINKLLEIQPNELEFITELKKQSSCSVRLANITNYYVAFKVKTTAQKKYSVKPNVGIVLPYSTCHITVKRQAPQTAPLDLLCNDKFLVQSTIVSAVTTVEDITASMFDKDGRDYVEENKLRAILVNPQRCINQWRFGPVTEDIE